VAAEMTRHAESLELLADLIVQGFLAEIATAQRWHP
jgi:hypothetical protein